MTSRTVTLVVPIELMLAPLHGNPIGQRDTHECLQQIGRQGHEFKEFCQRRIRQV